MKSLLLPFTLILLLASITSCSIANLQPDALVEQRVGPNPEEQGRALLAATVAAMGYDKLAQTQSYGVTANFKWATVWGMMPMNSLPGAKNKDIRFRFATNTFDGQLEFLEGNRQGEIVGVQSWQAYRKDNDQSEANEIGSKRYPWGLATYHYMLEGPHRLLGADIIRYAGERSFDGQEYDLVFATWGDGTDKKHMDQWLVYINKATGFVDVTEVTITDFFLPMPGGMKNATIRYPERTKTDIGAYLPTKCVIQLGHPKEKIDKDVYTFSLQNYRFDNFSLAKLYPIAGLPRYGDSKPVDARK